MCLKAARGAWHGGYISINSNNLCLGQMLSATLKLAGRAGQSLNGYNVILPAAPHHAYNIATLCSAAVLQAAAAQSDVFGESPPPPCRYTARTATCINNSNCLTLHTDTDNTFAFHFHFSTSELFRAISNMLFQPI